MTELILKNCPACQADVSSQALHCPKCGHRLRTPVRTPFGKFVKWGFIGFNVLMLLLLFSVMGSTSETVNQVGTDPEKAGAAIGGMLGMGFVLFLWFFGFVGGGITMLLTRPQQ